MSLAIFYLTFTRHNNNTMTQLNTFIVIVKLLKQCAALSVVKTLEFSNFEFSFVITVG